MTDAAEDRPDGRNPSRREAIGLSRDSASGRTTTGTPNSSLAAVAARLTAARDFAKNLEYTAAADMVSAGSMVDGPNDPSRLSQELARALVELEASATEVSAQQSALSSMARELELQHQRYRDLFELAPDAYLVTTRDGEIVEANRAAHTLFNVPDQSLVGHLLGVYLMSRRERPVILQEMAELDHSDGGRREWVGRLRRRGAQTFDVAVTLAAIRDPDMNHVLGARWLVRDISAWISAETEVRRLNVALERRVAERTSELERRTEELDQRTIEAESANRAKAQFLAAMSHEIRTPLNAIGGYAELLEMEIYGTMTERQRDFVQRIRRANGHLLALLSDTLNFARLESSRVQFADEPVSLDETLAAAEAMIELQAAERRIRFTRRPCEPESVARGDGDKVLQIVLNLLANAVKFTEQGGEITVSCGHSAHLVWIDVSDTGSGIPADQLDAIFEPFVQVGQSAAGGGHGVGLGLAISRKLAGGMNGTLTVQSAVGKGSSFRLTLTPYR